jgi:crotonobetainyl-CoA:carnitine CoA-transferase CaiB-like acyl-CoA transferase
VRSYTRFSFDDTNSTAGRTNEDDRRHRPGSRNCICDDRGKKSLCLDLRSERGKEIFAALVKTSDIVLQNFRPGVMEKMGFRYDRLRELKPDIILARSRPSANTAPTASARASTRSAMSRLMSLTGMPVGTPLGTASSIVDRYTSLHATIGMLAALHHRDRTGEGHEVDVCLMDSGLTMVEIPTSYYLATGQEGGEGGRPPYKAKDGHVVISASGREMGSRLLQVATGDPNATANTGAFTGRMGLGDSPRKAVEAWCLAHTVDEIVTALVAADIPVAPVKTIPQVAQDPHLWEREMLVKMDDPVAGEMYLPGATIKMSKTPGRIGPVPMPGQHTD